MGKKDRQLTMQQQNAIDLIVANPGIKNAELAKVVNVSTDAIYNWLHNAEFTNRCYDRFMQLRSVKLMSVLDSMFREAEEGSVAAARLIFEHYGRLEKRINIKIESPFERFLNAKEITGIVDGDFTAEDAKELASTHVRDSELPPRNPEINTNAYKGNDTKRIKRRFKTARAKQKNNVNQNVRHHLRKRAKDVKLPPMPPGKPKAEVRNAWMRELKKREEDLGIIYPD